MYIPSISMWRHCMIYYNHVINKIHIWICIYSKRRIHSNLQNEKPTSSIYSIEFTKWSQWPHCWNVSWFCQLYYITLWLKWTHVTYWLTKKWCVTNPHYNHDNICVHISHVLNHHYKLFTVEDKNRCDI